jgi:membrane protein implicated in regulation of membrane protease activity
MDFLSIIDNVQPWQWLVIGVLIVSVSIFMLGDSFLPLVAISIFLVAVVDYLNLKLSIQFIVFSVSLISMIVVAPKFINKKDNLIAETVHDMIGHELRLISINSNKSSAGKAVAQNGKSWNVIHDENKNLTENNIYECIKVEGINLVVKDK